MAMSLEEIKKVLPYLVACHGNPYNWDETLIISGQ
jgi:hypothetical protein